MVQFHAVALLHALRATDRLAISKLVTSLVRGSVRSPLAQCLLVRYVAQVSPPFPLHLFVATRPFHSVMRFTPDPSRHIVFFGARRAQLPEPASPPGGQVIAESGSPGGSEPRPYYDFLEGCLRHKSEMVIFEAARAICNMKDVTSR